MGQTAALLGIPTEFSFEGKSLRVVPRNLDIESAYEDWLEQEALAWVQRRAPDMARPGELRPGRLSPVEYQMQLEGLRRDGAAQVYAFDGPVCLQSLFTPRGRKELAYLQLGYANPTIDRNLVDRLFNDEEALLRFEEAQRRAGRDPNFKMPVDEVTGN